MEEARLTAYLFQKLLDAVFLTEHNMARQLGLSYKVLRLSLIHISRFLMQKRS